MTGRRWSEGLHQAMEAKEGVPMQNENQTLASITFQNYFRLYNKLSGMTGTADTEAFELNRFTVWKSSSSRRIGRMIRNDLGDLVYLTVQEKYNAVTRGHQGMRQTRPARAGRHHIHRKLGTPFRHADKAEH